MKEFFENWWFLLTMLALATILSFVYLFVWNRKTLKAKWWELLIVSVTHTAFVILCVKFWALLEAGFDAEKAGNMSLFGATFLIPIYYAIYAIIKKLPFRLVFDRFVPLVLIAFFARCNCLHSGCCLGVMTSGGWRVPTREIELIYYAIFVIFVSPWVVKGASKGLAYPIYMLSYGFVRFVLEWFRDAGNESLFHIGHIWAIVSMIIGAALIAVLVISNKKKSNKSLKTGKE